MVIQIITPMERARQEAYAKLLDEFSKLKAKYIMYPILTPFLKNSKNIIQANIEQDIRYICNKLITTKNLAQTKDSLNQLSKRVSDEAFNNDVHDLILTIESYEELYENS